ncbi:response regulator [Longimicrobium terrae]|uniref:CheY-like chemotaxis protein n=1 Tax=Longimicrobium terrae TaxID=1639882 RepID=A0A841H399_9BACT|nr:CheY-like chemotaxis protein [Longimicrobium terrae]MBB6072432.1 CheY-like chemotaxis protein [Longimicrobium terrae]
MTPVTVLIVDDDADHHAVCGVFLEHAGYRVLHASDGAEGIRMARAERPDVVLMDVRMPKMDGVTARRLLAGDPATARIPVAAVTADVMVWPRERALAEGFDAHMDKPCSLLGMGRLIRRLLERGGQSDIAPPLEMAVLVA